MLGEIKSDQFFLRIYAQLSEDTDNTDTDECTTTATAIVTRMLMT